MREADTAGILGQIQAGSKHNTLDRLSLIKAPTLVIAGTKDRAVKPASSETLAGLIPNAKLVWLENGSHVACVEMKDRFNREILSFLKGEWQSPRRAAFC
jgi:3-oxoadipate enol-lactonase